MTLYLIILVLFAYASGAYFFLYQKQHVGSCSIPFRIICFIVSPLIVPSCFYEAAKDSFRRRKNAKESKS